MLSSRAFTAIAALFALLVTKAAAGDVYAHFILGNAGAYTQSDWAKDIALAADSKIDGFALNIGGDSYTDTQLGYAYAAAEAHGNFKMFISFDYGANPGFSASGVASTINKYKGSSAQAQYSGKPLVSTFEGPSAAGDWPGIKSSTGCFFVPDWTSAKGTPSTFSVADGALSWDIWPTTAADMTDANDKAWQSLLGSKVYMMGISPWFYTNLPAFNKNWLWRSNGLWYDRWQQALEIQPQLIEIVTWNDFGESSYIGPIVQSEVVPGAGAYVNNNPHDGWRALLPYYIDAYKNGNQASTPTVDILSWAHQPNPVNACGTGGTTGGQDGGDPTQYAEDLIDVDVALTAPADISVTIGGGTATTKSAVPAGISHFQIPFNGQTGQVVYTVSRNGATVMTVQGTTISSDCTTVNWNAVTGSQTT